MKKIYLFILTLFLGIFVTNIKINATYNYTPNGEVISSATALVVQKTIDATNLIDVSGNKVDISFYSLQDIATFNEKIYIVDSGKINSEIPSESGKIIILDKNYRYLDHFPKDTDSEQAKLKQPKGIFITKNYIYVADYENYRIAIYDHDYKFHHEITTPDDATFIRKNEQPINGINQYFFKPCKIAVDRTGRVYAFCENIFEGFVDLDADGTFNRYIGANEVQVSAWDAFWLMFTTEAQKKKQGSRISETLVNLNVDKDGYLYVVSKSNEGAKAIKKLNFKGNDILTRNGYTSTVGDTHLIYGGTENIPTGASEFVDIDVNDIGTYIVLDKNRGRIFAYDFDGNLLYIGGELGNVGGKVTNQHDTLLNPVALCYFDYYNKKQVEIDNTIYTTTLDKFNINGLDYNINENKILYKENYYDVKPAKTTNILVADSTNNNIVVYGYSTFAELVNTATYYYYLNDFDKAAFYWEKVLEINTNYYLAYAGIGKAQLRNGDYETAMNNLKLGYDRYNYSKAYKQYRYEQLNVIIPYIIGAVILLLVYSFAKSIKKSVKAEREDEDNE